MKKFLQILLLLLITVLICRRANSQDDCDAKMRKTVSLSYEYVPHLPTGINVHIGGIAQTGKISILMGAGVHRDRMTMEEKKDGMPFIDNTQLSLSISLGYKLIHEYKNYSLHVISSAHFYEIDGLYYKGGMRLVIPAGYKAFYFEPSLTNKFGPSLEMGIFLDL